MAKTKGIIQVYTDGSYNQYKGVGGYGAVIFMNNRMKKFSSAVSYVDTSVHRMEVRAILAVLKRIKPGYSIDIYSDSEYCTEMIRKWHEDRFIHGKVNRVLWAELFKHMDRHISNGSNIKVSWIRGHAGNTFNEMADELASIGASREKKVVCDAKEKPNVTRVQRTMDAIEQKKTT